MSELKLAKSTSDIKILRKLSESVYSNVRRVVAKNMNTPKDVLKKLSFDPVLNVSFVAVNNPNNSVNRTFQNIVHPCVQCNKDEYSLDCTSCQQLKKFKIY